MSDLNGVFNVYKEAGWTSFDVVAKMRGLCHIKKIGHTGTLDPAATGVLPVCVGKATKIVSLLADDTKTYRAGLRFGLRSDTQDMTGQPERTASEEEVAAITSEQLQRTAGSFVGGYDQIPPMYSAKHYEGRRLYELAREGQEVERRPVRVIIDELEAEMTGDGEAEIIVTCGKGTYIRTLIADIGEKLGVGAVMTSLCRIRVGRFDIADALPISRLQELADAGQLGEAILPVDQVFADLPAVTVGIRYERMALNGNPLPIEAVSPSAEGEAVRLYTADTFVGLFRRGGIDGLWRPDKMFV